MAIDMKGPVEPESLSEIFKILMDQDSACSLLVSDGVSEKIFYFSIGGLRMVSIGGRKSVPIGEVLIAGQHLTPDRRDKILERSQETNQRFGETAQELGYVTRREVDAAVRSQVEAELCDLYLWENAEYEFTDGQPPSQFYDSRYRACSISVDVPELIRGVQQRREQLNRIRKRIPTDREIFEPTEKGEEIRRLKAEDAVSRILSNVDGLKRVKEIIEATGFSALTVNESLFTLLEEGLIHRTKSSEDYAELNREEILAEIAKLEKARSEVLGDLILRTRLARAYEQIGENAKAAAIWKEICQLHRRKNDLRSALGALQNAARCVPLDFNTRERMLEIYRVMKDHGKLLEEGRILAERFLKNNLLNRARNLLSNLTGIAPNDPRVRKLYALTLLGLGDKELALWQLKELAKILERDPKRAGELKEVYRRILALDKGNRAVRQKLLAATGGRKAILLSRAVMALAGVVLLIAGGIFFYERSARESYAEGVDLERLLLDHEFERAKRLVSRVRDEFPFSSLARNAGEYLERIEQSERDYLEHGLSADLLRARRAQEAGNISEAAKIYERIGRIDPSVSEAATEAIEYANRFKNREEEAARRVQQGRQLADQGELDAAIRVYRGVLKDYPKSRAVTGINWPVRIDSVPSGARVFLNGSDLGPTPRLVYYSLSTKSRIELELRGFEKTVIEVKEPLDADRVVRMRKNLRWTFAAEGPFESSPVIHDGTLYITGRDRHLYAIDVADGRAKFRVNLGIFGDSSSTPVFAGGIVVVGTSRGELLGINAVLGSIQWRRDVGASIGADLAASPDGALVYVTLSDGLVLAVDAETGVEVWARSAGAAPSSAPVVARNFVLVGSYDRRSLLAIDAKEGKEVWTVEAEGAVSGSAGVEDDYACFGSDDRFLYAVNMDTGDACGPYRASGMVKARPVVRDRLVWFGAVDGNFYCYPIVEGAAAAWQRSLGNPILGAATVHGEKVYVGTTGGELFCLDRKTGATRWIFETSGKIVSRPLVQEGTVYLSSTDGRIYAIED